MSARNASAAAGLFLVMAIGSASSSAAVAAATPSPAPSPVSGCPSTRAAPMLELGRAEWLVVSGASGGFVSRHTLAQVRSDGMAWVDACAFTLKPAELAAVERAVASSSASAWKPSYLGPGNGCCDQVYHRVAITRHVHGRLVTYASEVVDSTAAQAPPDFHALQAAVGQATSRYSRFFALTHMPEPSPSPAASPSPAVSP